MRESMIAVFKQITQICTYFDNSALAPSVLESYIYLRKIA